MAKAKELDRLEVNDNLTWEVGQRVVVDRRMNESIRTVTRITDGRDGTVYVKEGKSETAFDRFGNQRGADTWSRARMEPATESDVKRVKGKIARNQLSRFEWHELDPDKALEIRDLLREKGLDI
jgi:hypothetical protein